MSRLEELIQRYCPEGVEYVTIENVTKSICSGLNPRQNFALNVSGADCKYLTVKEMASGKIIFSDKTDKITREAVSIIQNRSRLEVNDILLSGIGTIGRVAIVDIPVDDWNCSESVLLLKSDQSIIAPKYLKYILESNDVQTYFDAHATGSTLKGIRQKDLRSLEIPLPPLPVQEEIVRILDTFTELQAELQAELQKRKQQYNYYRDNLLSFEGRTDVEWKKLGEVCAVYDGTHQTPEYKDSGIPFISVENIGNIYSSKKYISKEDFDKYKIKPQVGDVFMTRIGSIGVCAVFDKAADIAYYVSLALLRPNQDFVHPRFLKHIIESLTGCKELRKRTLVNAVPIKVNKDDIGKIVLPFPSLAEQQKIVDILDRFDTLTNDLAAGLPAEIEKRRQQYEYYRDKLLTFKRKESGQN